MASYKFWTLLLGATLALSIHAKVVDSGPCGLRADRFMVQGKLLLADKVAMDSVASRQAKAQQYFRVAYDLCQEDSVKARVILPLAKTLVKKPSELTRLVSDYMAKSQIMPTDSLLFLLGQAYFENNADLKAREALEWLSRLYPKSLLRSELELVQLQARIKNSSQSDMDWHLAGWTLESLGRLKPADPRLDSLRYEWALAPKKWRAYALADSLLEKFIIAGSTEELIASARQQRGTLQAAQGNMRKAFTLWQEYLDKHPRDSGWRTTLTGMESMLFAAGVRLGQTNKPDSAIAVWNEFFQKYPASDKIAQALFNKGEAQLALFKGADAATTFQDGIVRYPTSPSLGSLYYGLARAHELQRHYQEAKVAVQKASKAGSYQAIELLKAYEEPFLKIAGSRIQTIPGKGSLQIMTRNVDSVEVRVFPVDAEDFFRSRFDFNDLTQLDIALCKPTKRLIKKIPEAEPLLLLSTKLSLELAKPGSYLVTVGSGDIEGVSPVWVSNLQLVLTHQGNELIAMVRNKIKNQLVAGAKVLVSDGNKIVYEGVTGKDGVLRHQIPLEKSGNWQVLALQGGDATWATLENVKNIQALADPVDEPKWWTSMSVYHPLDTLQVMGMIWNSKGKVSGGNYRVELWQNGVRYWTQKVVLDSLYSFQAKYPLATAPAQGAFDLKLSSDHNILLSKTIWVRESQNIPVKQWNVVADQKSVSLGQPMRFQVSLLDEAGTPMAGQPIILTSTATPSMPRRLGVDSAITVLDAKGHATLTLTPQNLVESFTAELPNLGLQRIIAARVVKDLRQLNLDLVKNDIREGESVQLRVESTGAVLVELWQTTSHGERLLWQKSLPVETNKAQVINIPELAHGQYKLLAKTANRNEAPLVKTRSLQILPRTATLTWSTKDTLVVPGTRVRFHIKNTGAPTHALLTSVHSRLVDVQSVFLPTGSTELNLLVGEGKLPEMGFQLTAIQGDSLVQLKQLVNVSSQLDISATWAKDLYDGDSVQVQFQVTDAMGRPVRARLFVTSLDQRSTQLYPNSWIEYSIASGYSDHHLGSMTQSGFVWFDSVLAKRIEAVKIVESTSNDGSNALESKRKMMTSKAAKESQVEGWLDNPSAVYVLEGGSGGIGDMLGGLLGGSSGSVGTKASGRMRVAEISQAYYPYAASTVSNLQTNAQGQATLRMRLPVGVATNWNTQVVALSHKMQLGTLDTSIVAKKNSKNADWQVPALVRNDLWPRTMEWIAAEYAMGTLVQRQRLRIEAATLQKKTGDMLSRPWFWSTLVDLPAGTYSEWESRSQMETRIREVIAINNIELALLYCQYAGVLDVSVVPQEFLLRLQRSPKTLSDQALARLSLVWKVLKQEDKRSELKPYLQKALNRLTYNPLSMDYLLLLESLDGGSAAQVKVAQQKLSKNPGAAPDIQAQALRLWKNRSLLPNALPIAALNQKVAPVGIRFQAKSPLPSKNIPIGYDGIAGDSVVPPGRALEMRITIPNRLGRLDADWATFAIPEGLSFNDPRVVQQSGRGWVLLNRDQKSYEMTVLLTVTPNFHGTIKIPAWEYVAAGSLVPQSLTRPSILKVQHGVERQEADLSPSEKRVLVSVLRDIQDNKKALRILESLYQQNQSTADLDTLLQIAIALGEAKPMVEYFEQAKERHPELMVSFENLDKLLDAYKSLKYKEATALFEKGLRNARFQAELADIGKFKQLGNVPAAWTTMNDLLQKHAGLVDLNKPRYHFAQLLYQYVDEGASLDTLGRKRWLVRVIELLEKSLASKAKADYGPSAIYTLATAYLEQGNTAAAIQWCNKGLEWYPNAEEARYISYLRAFATFRKGDYSTALDLCAKIVNDKKMGRESIQMATYIMAQIYHARGEMDKALTMYRKVDFADAREVVRNADRRFFKVPTSLILNQDAPARIPVLTRNVSRFDLRIYSVDPLKMVQRKGTIDHLGDLNFAGIQPMFAQTVQLPNRPGVIQHKNVDLGSLKNGAYLLLLRTDREVRQTLCVLGALDVELDRVNQTKVRIVVKDGQGKPLPGASVQVKGADNDFFTTGRTDARGIFSADSLEGNVQGLVEFKGRYGIAQEANTNQSDAEIDSNDEDEYFEDDFEEDDQQSITKPVMKRESTLIDEDYFNNDIKGMEVNRAM